MDITRERTPGFYMYTLGGEPLQYVDQQRLLGVNIACDLRWNTHTDIWCAQNLGLAREADCLLVTGPAHLDLWPPCMVSDDRREHKK